MIQLPVLVESKARCTGCSACCEICPSNAISMIADKEGFLYPVINGEVCVGCQRCVNVCPVRTKLK